MANKKAVQTQNPDSPMTEDKSKHKALCPHCQSEMAIDGMELWCYVCGFTDLIIGFSKRRRT